MRRLHASWLPTAAWLGAVLVTVGCAVAGAAMAAPSPDLELTVATGRGEQLSFTPQALAAPAGATIRVTLENRSSQAHNLTFQAPISAGTRTIVDPGAMDAVVFRAPGPGVYTFVCTIHMGMTGTLTVTP